MVCNIYGHMTRRCWQYWYLRKYYHVSIQNIQYEAAEQDRPYPWPYLRLRMYERKLEIRTRSSYVLLNCSPMRCRLVHLRVTSEIQFFIRIIPKMYETVNIMYWRSGLRKHYAVHAGTLFYWTNEHNSILASKRTLKTCSGEKTRRTLLVTKYKTERLSISNAKTIFQNNSTTMLKHC